MPPAVASFSTCFCGSNRMAPKSASQHAHGRVIYPGPRRAGAYDPARWVELALDLLRPADVAQATGRNLRTRRPDPQARRPLPPEQGQRCSRGAGMVGRDPRERAQGPRHPVDARTVIAAAGAGGPKGSVTPQCEPKPSLCGGRRGGRPQLRRPRGSPAQRAPRAPASHRGKRGGQAGPSLCPARARRSAPPSRRGRGRSTISRPVGGGAARRGRSSPGR